MDIRLNKTYFNVMVLCLCSLLLLCSGANGEESADSYYQLGLEAFKNSQPVEARNNLQKALDLNPSQLIAGKAQYWIGETFYAEKHWEPAILAYQEVIKNYPGHEKVPAAMMKQAKAFNMLGDTKSARYVFKKLLEAYPSFAEANNVKALLNGLGAPSAPLNANALVEEKKPAKKAKKAKLSEAGLKEEIGKDPDNIGNYLRLGKFYSDKGRHDEAVSTITNALQRSPENEDALLALADAYVAAGKHSEAIKTLLEVQKLHKDSLVAAMKLGSIYLDNLNKPEDARLAFQEALRISPADVDAYGNLGRAFITMQKYDKALEALNKALAIKPDESWLQNNVGICYLNQKKYDLALAVFRKTAAMDKEDWETQNWIGETLINLKRNQEAVAAFREATRIAPNEGTPQINLANLYLTMKDETKAIAVFRQLITSKPEYLDAYWNLATIYTKAKKDAEAVAVYRNAIANNQNNQNAYQGYLDYLIEKGKTTEAVSLFKKARDLDPDKMELYLQVANAFRSKDRLTEAEEIYRDGIKHNELAGQLYIDFANLYRWSMQGGEAKALAVLVQGVEKCPDFILLRQTLAEVHLSLGHFQEALDTVQGYLNPLADNLDNAAPIGWMAPTAFLAEAYMLRARAQVGLEDYAGAEESVTAVRTLAEKSQTLHQAIGFYYFEMGRFTEAEKEIKLLLALDKKEISSWGLSWQTQFLTERNRFPEALETVSKALRDWPSQWDLHIKRAEILRKMGRHEESLEEYNFVLRSMPNFPDAHAGKAVTFYLLGRLKESDKELAELAKDTRSLQTEAEVYLETARPEKALTIAQAEAAKYPQSAWAQLLLAKTYEALGKQSEALTAYLRTVELAPLNIQAREKLAYLSIKSGDKTSALQQYAILKNIGADGAHSLFDAIYATSPPTVATLPALGQNSSDAPIITITSPTRFRGVKLSAREQILAVTGRVSDKHGVAKLSINGRNVLINNIGEFSADVLLKNGENEIAVIAENTNQVQSIERFTITREANSANIGREGGPADDSLVKGKYFALIIGVKDYNDNQIPSLDYPMQDAQHVFDLLTSGYTFDKDNVIFLKNPEQERIIGALDQLAQRVSEEDNLLIFYAGHGFWDEKLRQGFWLPADAAKGSRARWLSNSTIRDYINGIRSKHTLLVADACFSGGIFKTRGIFDATPKAMQELYKLPSRKAITSGAMKEVPDRSVFVEYLLKRLKDNRETYVSSEDLFSSMRQAVINNSPNNQVPQFGEIKETGDEGGDFIFVRKK